jgi:hypothetical protein
MTAPVEDEFTELVDADIPRVDLVGKTANGMRFLIAKQADGSVGLMDPAFVRDLISKAEPEPALAGEKVTMTGSPAAIVKLIHQAAQRAADPVEKAKYDADDLRRMAASGAAMKDESYPVADREDLDRAIRAVGRGGADHDAIRRHVIARAKALGASSEIPDNWLADGSLKDPVAKETDMTDTATVVAKADGDLDPTTVLADPGETYDGVPTNPGSPAWEAVDAATARKWTSILARAKAAVDLLADREMLEAAAGDGDDEMQAFDLQDACCAIDYAIGVLAPFAVAEQAEADCAEDMAVLGKALTGWDPQPLDTIEALGQVRKAGKVLSAANEAAIRAAVDSLQNVLASLPAPVGKEAASGQPVADVKETEMPTPQTSAETVAEHGEQPQMGIAKTDDASGASGVGSVAKADGEGKAAMRAVYDAKGHLVGIVDPADITPIEDATPDDDGDGDEPDADGDGGKAADMQPAPAGEVGTPADAVPDGVEKTTTTTDTTADAVLKSIADVIKAELGTYSASQEQVIAKQAADLAAMAETIEVLKGQVTALEEQPAEPKVFTNGAIPPAHHLRGQDRGALAEQVDVAKAREMKQALYRADAPEQNRIAADMQTQAIQALAAIHQRRT